MAKRTRTVDELHAMAFDHAQYLLIECPQPERQITPTWWIQLNDGPGEMLITPWDGEDEKMVIVGTIRQRLKDPRVLSYAFVSEVWVATEKLGERRKLTPMQRPDRQEKLMVHAFDRAGQGGVKIYNMRRTKAGKLIKLPEDKGLAGGYFEGRMFNLFKDQQPDNVVRRGADVSGATRESLRAAKREILEHTTRTPLSHCLDCGMIVTAGTPSDVNAPDYRPPQPGDLAICINCAHVMAYGDDLRVRALTDQEMIEVAGDADMVEAVNKIAAYNRSASNG